MSTTPTNPKMEAICGSVQKSYADLNQLIDGPLGGLDANKLYQATDENEWQIMQKMADILEFMPYWAGEIESLVASPGETFGRTAQDEGRLGAINERWSNSLGQIKAALPGSYARLDEVLSRLRDSDVELTGQHVRYGEKPVEWLIVEMVTEHLRGHVEQIKGCLVG